MTTKKQQIDSRMRSILFVRERINFTNMSDDQLSDWSFWLAERHEQDYSNPRARSYFRVNQANLKTEILWRKGELPF